LSALAAGLGIETLLYAWPVDVTLAAWVRMVLVVSFSVGLIWSRLRRPLIPTEGASS
jgi:hypothetical protein